MNLFKIFQNPVIDSLYWNLIYGKSKRKISPDSLKRNLQIIPNPAFFLSTGRCGTSWFAHYLAKDSRIKSVHAPLPDFGMENCMAYNLQKEDPNFKNQNYFDALKAVFLVGREQFLRYSYKTNKRYFETNNHLTFFAPIIASILPQSQFVHIVRNPLEFIKSGLNRGWYNGHDNSRQIVPYDLKFREEWLTYSRHVKIAWLWAETNRYIEAFKSQMGIDRIITFNFNQLETSNLMKLNDFLRLNISAKTISKITSRKYNAGKHFNENVIWNDEINAEIRRQCGALAKNYGYHI